LIFFVAAREIVMGTQPGFDLEHRYERLIKAGDLLERLMSAVNFEAFRYLFEKALKGSDGSKGGRPPYDPELMFKVLILQALYNLSNEQAECMIRDRLSFMRFLGLGLNGAVLDATTIWLFREQLFNANTMEKLFGRFDKALTEQGYLAMSGQLMDAPLVPAARQRQNYGEKAEIKAGKAAQEIWPDKPARARQKDIDAKWTLKLSKAKPRIDGAMLPTQAVPVFGYKNHVSTDHRHGLIHKWAVTSGLGSDGARLPDLLHKASTASDLWADRYYHP
jgi:transposase, IS5 family